MNSTVSEIAASILVVGVILCVFLGLFLVLTDRWNRTVRSVATEAGIWTKERLEASYKAEEKLTYLMSLYPFARIHSEQGLDYAAATGAYIYRENNWPVLKRSDQIDAVPLKAGRWTLINFKEEGHGVDIDVSADGYVSIARTCLPKYSTSHP